MEVGGPNHNQPLGTGNSLLLTFQQLPRDLSALPSGFFSFVPCFRAETTKQNSSGRCPLRPGFQLQSEAGMQLRAAESAW